MSTQKTSTQKMPTQTTASHTMRDQRLQIQSHNVQSGSVHLELRRCNLGADGIPVIMMPGFFKTSDIFMPEKGEGGLASFLANLGYDVFLAELRGRGKSWPGIVRGSAWGAHEAICNDIPAHLRVIERLRPGAPQIWLGQDFSSLLLSAAYARGSLSTPVLGMVHMGAARYRPETPASKRFGLWAAAARLSAVTRGFVGWPFGDPSRRETPQSLACWLRWQTEEPWSDPVDSFDYAEALKATPPPPSLYFANSGSSLWGRVEDTRRWVAEMGEHDARIVAVGRRGGNQHNYSHRGLLQHPHASEDHFIQLQDWLSERSSSRLMRSVS